MFKFNLLNNNGIQSNNSSLDLGSEKYNGDEEQELLVSNPNLDDSDKKIFENFENELDTQDIDIPKKKINFIKPFIYIIFIISLSGGGLYLYNYTDLINNMIEKFNFHKKKIIKSNMYENQIDQKNIQSDDIFVSSSICQMISEKNIDLNIFTGVLELIPNNALLYDLNIKKETLSLICIVNDIISGENIKFFFYNHKLTLKPELFYIEQTENLKKYQITALVKLLARKNMKTDLTYQTDKQLFNIFNNIANKFNVKTEPLTISKRDYTKIRKAHVVVSGSKNQIINYLRKLNLSDMNIAISELVFEHSDENSLMADLQLKIEFIIYPQNI